MSTRIGWIRPKPGPMKPGHEDAALHVWVSTAGVELHSEPKITLSPEEARDYAALLVAGAHRAEGMYDNRLKLLLDDLLNLADSVISLDDQRAGRTVSPTESWWRAKLHMFVRQARGTL